MSLMRGNATPAEEKDAKTERGSANETAPSSIVRQHQEDTSQQKGALKTKLAVRRGSGESEATSTSHSGTSSPHPKDLHHARVTLLADPARIPDPEVVPFPTFTMPVEPVEAFKEAAQLCIRQQQHKQVGSASAVARQHNLQGLEECLTVKKAEALIASSGMSQSLLTHFAAESFVVAMGYERVAAHMFHKRRMSSSAESSQHLPTSTTFSNLDLREMGNPLESTLAPPAVESCSSGGSDSVLPENGSFGERRHGGASADDSPSVIVVEPPKQAMPAFPSVRSDSALPGNSSFGERQQTVASVDSPTVVVLDAPKPTLKPHSTASSAGSESGDESPHHQGPGRNPFTLGADIPDILLRFTDKYHFDHIPTEDIRKALRNRSHEEQTSMLVDLLSAVRGLELQQRRHQILSANTSSGQMSVGSPTVGLHAMPSMKTLPTTQLVHDLEVGEDDAGFPTVNAYTIIGEAGKGSYGSVKIALNATGDQRAIKVMPKGKLRKKWADAIRRRMGSSQEDQSVSGVPLPASPDSDELSKLHHEIAVMKKIRHQNIVPLLEVIDDPNEDVLYLVMPYIERGPLLRMTPQGTCAPLDIDVAKGYMRQLLDAMQYLHERHIVHRDIKPDNILLGNDGRVYLSDFGVSQMFKEDEEECVDAFGGTPAFMAPECFAGNGHDAILGKPVDVWALGVTFYSMVLGHLPFEGQSVLEMGTAIKTEELQLPPLESFPADRQPDYQLAFDLLHEMLQKDPKLRFSVRQCRFHPFVCRMKSRVDILRHHPRVVPQAKERASLSPQRRELTPPLQSRHRSPQQSSTTPPATFLSPGPSIAGSPLHSEVNSLISLGLTSDGPAISVSREEENGTLTSDFVAIEVTDEERQNAFTYCFRNDATERVPSQASQWSRQMLKSTTAASPLLRGPSQGFSWALKRQDDAAAASQPPPWSKPSLPQ